MSKKRKWTDEQLVEAVKSSESYQSVLRKLGLKLCGGSHAHIKMRVRQLGLDISHFRGKGWCYGEKRDALTKRCVEIPIEKVLIKDSTYQNTHALKKRLLKLGLLENKCQLCGIGPEWNGQPLSLQLDHQDGDRCNNEIKNLRLACPNCHSQTATFAGKGKKKNGLVAELADAPLSKSGG